MSTRTLTRAGTVGHARPYEFVGTRALMRHISDTENDVSLTIGLTFRDPETRDMHWYDAMRWVERNGKNYVFEAFYRDDDDTLYVNALSRNDLF